MWSLLLGAMLAAMPAEPVAERARAERVAELVGQLDAAALTERDRAYRQLQSLGTEILPLLPAVGEDTSPEAAQRLTRLRQELMRAQAKSIVEPSQITLSAKQMPLAEMLAELARQSGNRIVDHREAFGQQPTDHRFDVEFDDTPFWQALDLVLDAADLTLYGFAGEPGLLVINRRAGKQPRAASAVYVGAFCLQPLRFEAVRDLRDEDAGALRLFVDVSWEPRLQPFALLQPLDKISATGSDEQAISPASKRASLETLVRPGFSSTELEIPLALPPRSVASIRELSGELMALIPGPREEFRFDALPLAVRGQRPKPIRQRKADTTLTLDRVAANGDIWEATLRIQVDAPSAAFESHRGWMFHNEAFFVDADGNRHASGSVEQTRQTPDEIGLNYLFDLPDGPDGMALVYRTPLMVIELPIKYRLEDLRLP